MASGFFHIRGLLDGVTHEDRGDLSSVGGILGADGVVTVALQKALPDGPVHGDLRIAADLVPVCCAVQAVSVGHHIPLALILGETVEEGSHLLPGQGGVGREGVGCGAGGDTVFCGPEDSIRVPAIHRHIPEGILGGDFRLASQTVEGGGHHGPGQLGIGQELITRTLHQAVQGHIGDGDAEPVSGQHIRVGDGADAVLGLAVVLGGDDPVQLGGHIVHNHLVQGDTQIITDGGRAKGVVRVAACPQEVVGDDGVDFVRVKDSAAHSLDGHSVDLVGLGVGGAGVESAGCKGCSGVDGEGDARDLREAAQRFWGTIGGGLQGFQQLCAGDLDHVKGIAERQDRVDVLLGHIPGRDGGPDAAAVDDGSIGVVIQQTDLPEHGIGDQVTQVGLPGADIVPFSLQGHLGLGENGAVVGIDLRLDLGSPGGDGLVRQERGKAFRAQVGGVHLALRADLDDTD